MANTQYTIRSVPPSVNKELRDMARRSGRSLNAVTLNVLEIGLNLQHYSEPNFSLDALFGKLDKNEKSRLDRASKELRVVDKKYW